MIDVSGHHTGVAKRLWYCCNSKWKRNPQMAYRFESCPDYWHERQPKAY